MILIVATPKDSHADAVERRLVARGATVVRTCVGDFPEYPLSTWVERDFRARTVLDGISLDAVSAVWYRRLGWPQVDMRMPAQDRAFAYHETQAALLGLAQIFDARTFGVNPLEKALVTERGCGKLHQLELAREAGLAIPRTLATNHPREAREFVERVTRDGGEVVYKPFLAPVVHDGKDDDARERKQTVFTNLLDDAALAKLDGVRAAPCLFQERIAKRIEIRATVIGQTIFATEIHSQTREGAKVDFRRDYALGATPYRAHDLPYAIWAKLQAVMRGLGLRFGCADLILTPEGEYVFLEVNQQGQWLWLEEQTGQPLLENFCRMLMSASEGYEPTFEPHMPGIFPEA